MAPDAIKQKKKKNRFVNKSTELVRFFPGGEYAWLSRVSIDLSTYRQEITFGTRWKATYQSCFSHSEYSITTYTPSESYVQILGLRIWEEARRRPLPPPVILE
ncbi:hypothetical protein B0H13DRAFT_1909190 [Mycena leptocephala]|nr:hypothetical protein B0H13DRAFT_1909190 [Mycena leptocephala]